MFKVVYVLIVLSIASDVTNLGGHWFNLDEHGLDASVTHSYSMIFPGANAWLGRRPRRPSRRPGKKGKKTKGKKHSAWSWL